MYQKREKEKLEPMTVRLPARQKEAVSDYAKKHRVSKSVTVTRFIDRTLEDYDPQSTTYTDPEAAERLRKELTKVADRLEDIFRELHRIGVNYNQAIKMKNLEAKCNPKALVHAEKDTLDIDAITVLTESINFALYELAPYFKKVYGGDSL